MSAEKADPRLVRVVKGEANEEELAAVTALLLARATAPHGPTSEPRRTRARWQRLERAPGFRAPHDWQR